MDIRNMGVAQAIPIVKLGTLDGVGISFGSKLGMAHVMSPQKHAACSLRLGSKWAWLRPSLPIMKMATNLRWSLIK